ncbi:carboxylate--amine ligase [Arenibacter lacus]|uniref:carboxylate--amine ligase n=1 Tax=Arenibacter lacus TaxID=2608629 RepID=UPI00123D5357|nr:ATP-grasp domain-containing protein [Arenibacter lacus]
MRIGILEGHTIQAINAAKSIKKLGYKVILFYESKNSYGYYTKYADEKVLAPSVENNENEFHSFFNSYLESNTLDVVIPMFDFSAQYLSKHKDTLIEKIRFVIPAFDIFITGFDKNKFMRFCNENNIPHPKTFHVDEFEIIKSEIIFPAIIKPNITYGARGFAVVNSLAELEIELPNVISKFGDAHIQEFIPAGGRQYLVGIYMKDGELINSTLIEKMRYYPIKGGSSCFNKSVKSDELVEICYKASKALNWNGYAHYDLIEDPRSGEIKIMELNPRIQGAIKSSYIAGVDFIKNLVEDSLGQPVTKFEYNPGSYLRYLGLDLLWFYSSSERLKVKPSWFKGFFSSNHYLQEGSLEDIKPLLFGTLSGLFKQLDPRFRKSKKGMNQ